ncbi:MAG: hypothetical protein GX417_09985 [Clostridiales bacterium]|nr:hypothetical protein [Clostridiales bacterium]
MAIFVYEIRSGLSQMPRAHSAAFLGAVEAALGDSLVQSSLDQFLKEPFGLIYVSSGGSEGLFLQQFSSYDSPCYLLTSGDSNSLAASMEILAYLRRHGRKGEILHGDAESIAIRIRTLSRAARAKERLSGLRIGVVGKPSDWLIASELDRDACAGKLGVEVVDLPMDELLEAGRSAPPVRNEWTEQLLLQGYDRAETEKALRIYDALKLLVSRHRLGAVTVRCFDLLGSVCTTGCLALAILNAEGIYAGCEGDVPSTLSMAILGELSGRPVFMCNPSRIDTKAGHMVLAHCTLPVNMPEEMTLTTHFESGIGVAIAGSLPVGPCTVFKAGADLSRYYAKTGQIEKNLREPTLCRTQIQVALDDMTYFLTDPIQNHHLVCTGAYTDEIKEFFALL